MSPVRACAAHGVGNCRLCAKRRRASSPRRPYSDTAAYRAMLEQVLETCGALCHYCSRPIDLDPRADDPLELAHLVAHADGGAFELDNLRPAHRSCNRSAGRRG